jgi:hypothetical protein
VLSASVFPFVILVVRQWISVGFRVYAEVVSPRAASFCCTKDA